MIFFDIDDTLVNNSAAERSAAREFYRLHRSKIREPLDKFLKRWKVYTERNVQRYIAGELSFQDQRRERLRQLFNDRKVLSNNEADTMFDSYLNFYQNNWELFPEVKGCLNELSGERLGIISNGNLIQQKQKLESLGIIDMFSTIVISEDIGVSKPDPEIFITACLRAGMLPSECWHVGDDLKADVYGSIAAGLNGIWLNRNGKKYPTGILSIDSLNKLETIIS